MVWRQWMPHLVFVVRQIDPGIMYPAVTPHSIRSPVLSISMTEKRSTIYTITGNIQNINQFGVINEIL